MERKQLKQVTRLRPLIRECTFQFNVKCESLVKVNEFWKSSVTREMSQNFYVNALVQSGIADPQFSTATPCPIPVDREHLQLPLKDSTKKQRVDTELASEISTNLFH